MEEPIANTLNIMASVQAQTYFSQATQHCANNILSSLEKNSTAQVRHETVGYSYVPVFPFFGLVFLREGPASLRSSSLGENIPFKIHWELFGLDIFTLFRSDSNCKILEC